MSRPVVAIVGRPNVGKSTLFNKLAGKRISIVEDTPGVTRDRIYAEGEWTNKYFTLIDTGGIEPDTDDIILSQMRRQAEIAIDTGDVIIFVVDGKQGLAPADAEIAQMLRKSSKPVIIACNKIDDFKKVDSMYEFFELGMDNVIPISAGQGLGLGDLLDEVVRFFPEDKDTEYDDEVIKVAVIGKPNVGKSSIINRILGEERVIVSDIAGTTRDAIDTFYETEDDKFLFIDTAGLRRQKKIFEDIERYSVIRTLTAIERSDVCVIMIDATTGVTEQDAKIAGHAHNNGKASIILVNKWDLVEKGDKTYLRFEEDIRRELSFMSYAPILFISVETGKRVDKLLGLIKEVYENYTKRVSTGVLNDIIGRAILMNQPPTDKGKRLKIYYTTQVGIKPPKFVLFVNDRELSHFSYERYLENKIRESFEYTGTPIQFELNEKKEG